MAGGPPSSQNQHEMASMNINIETSGGLLNAPIVLNNKIQGDFTHKFVHNGPQMAPIVAQTEAPVNNVQPRAQHVGKTINIRSQGSIVNQPVVLDNAFAGNMTFEGELIPPAQMEQNAEQMDLK